MKKQSPGIRIERPVKVVKVTEEEGQGIEKPPKTGEENKADEKEEFELKKPDIKFGEK